MFVCRSQSSEASSVFFSFFFLYQSLGYRETCLLSLVFFQEILVCVSQNIEFSSYFGLNFSLFGLLLTNFLLTLSHNTSFTLLLLNQRLENLSNIAFFVTIRNTGRFFWRTRHKKAGKITLWSWWKITFWSENSSSYALLGLYSIFVLNVLEESWVQQPNTGFIAWMPGLPLLPVLSVWWRC